MTIIIMHTNFGDIHLELDAEKAPKTSENFIAYAKAGFYDGTIFHRVIDGFMIQGGGFTHQLSQKETQSPIQNEAANGLLNKRGTIAMARTSEPHSATSQFFINVADNDFLNFQSATPNGWGYCVFGRVTQGMDVVDDIKQLKTTSKAGHQNVPINDAIIESVEII